MSGRRVARTRVELGGNNGGIVMPDPDLKIIVRTVLFRTSLAAYGQVRIGSALEPETLMGPLLNQSAVQQTQGALQVAVEQVERSCTAGGL